MERKLTSTHFLYLVASIVEGFLFGIYSGIFAVYLRHHLSKDELDRAKQNIIFYTVCVLYVLSVVVVALDIAILAVDVFEHDRRLVRRLSIAQPIIFGFCDFIAQTILIHRCWIMWGRNIRVAIIPSILACAYLVMWTYTGSGTIRQKAVTGYALSVASLTASITVNALATGLIVFRIFKVFREVKNAPIFEPDEKSLGIFGGKQLSNILFVILESGMTLFAVQLARLVIITTKLSTHAEENAFTFIVSIHEMFNGIIPTVLLVRVSMGLCINDESESSVETVSNMQFQGDSHHDDDPDSTVFTRSFDRELERSFDSEEFAY